MFVLPPHSPFLPMAKAEQHCTVSVHMILILSVQSTGASLASVEVWRVYLKIWDRQKEGLTERKDRYRVSSQLKILQNVNKK